MKVLRLLPSPPRMSTCMHGRIIGDAYVLPHAQLKLERLQAIRVTQRCASQQTRWRSYSVNILKQRKQREAQLMSQIKRALLLTSQIRFHIVSHATMKSAA